MSLPSFSRGKDGGRGGGGGGADNKQTPPPPPPPPPRIASLPSETLSRTKNRFQKMYSLVAPKQGSRDRCSSVRGRKKSFFRLFSLREVNSSVTCRKGRNLPTGEKGEDRKEEEGGREDGRVAISRKQKKK